MMYIQILLILDIRGTLQFKDKIMHHVAKNDCLPCLSILVKTKSLTTLRLCDIHIFQYIVALHLIDPRVYRIGLSVVQNTPCVVIMMSFGAGKFTQL